MNADDFTTEVRGAIARCRENAAALAAGGDEPFATTIRAFDRLLEPLNGLEGLVHVHTQLHPDPAMRDASETLEQEIAALRTELSLDRGLFDRLSGLDAGEASSDGERRLLEHGLRDFRRSGVDRDEETREAIRALQEELVEIGQEFDRNIIQGTREFVIADGHAGLRGMPQDFLDAHPEREDGSCVIDTDPADRMSFLKYAERGDLRREYFLLAMNRAVPENLEVLPKLLGKRHRLATTLGYDHWADYVTEDKMTKSAAEARAFVERVISLVQGRARAEFEELVELKRETDPGAETVFDHERSFLVEKVRARRFSFDSQAVRPYFSFESVKEGVLRTSERLYGVQFRRNAEAPVWHPSVEGYDVLEGGEAVARVFLDLFPRENKFKHAALFHLAEGVEGGALAEAALVTNFPEPTEEDPALLQHDQVRTFFHEFGHLLHHLFAGRQGFLSFSGISTEWDFVEVPSQMYEEWAWNVGVLQTFARHHETGESIPEELVHGMRAAEEFGKGLRVLQQMYYALLSLTYYDRDPAGLDLERLMAELHEEVLPSPHDEGNRFHASFGHLHGYSAMYYTYMWSLVIAKDLFSRFESDLMNGATANEYRTEVLAPGGSLDARDLVSAFLGREYEFEAFERWLQA